MDGSARTTGRWGQVPRRQVPAGPFILDFYCVSARLAVEHDGLVHDDPIRTAEEERRTSWLREREGIHVLRFKNEEVVRDVDTVCDAIVRAARAQMDGIS